MHNDTRLAQLHEWIKELFGNLEYKLEPVSGDASFRRYFRINSNAYNFIAVDSPPDKESNDAFVNVTHLLEAEGLPVPHIHYSTLDSGFFLLDDFGDEQLLNHLNSENADALYTQALDALNIIRKTTADNLPDYNEELLLAEMELFRHWFLEKHIGIELNISEHLILDKTFKHLAESALAQPQVFVHRDYHSRNLMLIDAAYPGIIDYQDAVRGPITYDLVSLLRDCYIDWPQKRVESWVYSYLDKISNNNDKFTSDDEILFLKWFDLMGIQRHLKAIGIFARLNIRDNKQNYLADIPRTLNYIKNIAPKHSETQLLADLINQKVSV